MHRLRGEPRLLTMLGVRPLPLRRQPGQLLAEPLLRLPCRAEPRAAVGDELVEPAPQPVGLLRRVPGLRRPLRRLVGSRRRAFTSARMLRSPDGGDATCSRCPSDIFFCIADSADSADTSR
ncbi:hypothetical protein BJF79_20105 [Actinomadura sp. CNU-125]|uniref:hypothetical protein n=1 Tax=Actinomadura sp. CNU-125 TaxID=1904961 RepID=UPI000958E6C7|nr:hypothetical protein [Actinomadura sp. CNU-125]OLT13688.1 hypothetical protein BJF79_20105 [Actinomadura sp. CNU-125]